MKQYTFFFLTAIYGNAADSENRVNPSQNDLVYSKTVRKHSDFEQNWKTGIITELVID